MPMLTNNVKVLVTGASSGIGLGICQTLTKHGARVVGTGRNRDVLSKLKADGVIEDFMVADLSSPTSSADGIRPCKFVVDKAAELLGGLTTVVNSAGVIQTGAMGDVTIDNYDFNMNTNTRASFEIMTHAIPYLREAAASTKSGEISCAPSIVNISSVNGKQSFQGCTAYCMSKAAVDMMTKCASIDLAKDGIRVNSVNPGVIITNIHKVSENGKYFRVFDSS